MNDAARKESLANTIRPRFRGRGQLKCKYAVKYPHSPEREYQREADATMRLLNEVVKKHMPDIWAAQRRADSIEDGDRAPPPEGSARTAGETVILTAAIDRAFEDMARELAARVTEHGLRRKLESFAKLTRKLTVKEWKKAVRATLGIDIMEDYYNGDLFRQMLEQWVNDNVGLIVTIPQEALGQMKIIARSGFLTGTPTKEIVKQIQHTYDVSRSHARLLARDQISKLNGQLAETQQRDAGVKEYIWSTSGDSRVRDGHRALNNKRCRWDDPPDVGGGRRMHPGQDYQCRCVALPVFDLEGIDLPWEKRAKEQKK